MYTGAESILCMKVSFAFNYRYLYNLRFAQNQSKPPWHPI